MIALHGPYSIHILSADGSPRPYAWEKPDRRLTWYLLVLNLAGVEHIRVGGIHFEINPGESYLVPPGVECSLGSRQGNTPVWIHFEATWNEHRGGHPDAVPFAVDWAQRQVFAQPSPLEIWGVDFPVLIPKSLQKLYAESLPRLVQRWQTGMPIEVMQATHELSGLLLALVGQSSSVQPTGQRQPDLAGRIIAAERLAREHIGGLFGVTEFAAAAGFSRSRFSVLYKRLSGISPGCYLRNLRLTRAETLLRDTDLPIVDISALSGYQDPSVFCRLFRQHHCVSPAEWRFRANPQRFK